MKKVFAILLSLFFFATLSMMAVSCKKAEEPAPIEAAAPAIEVEVPPVPDVPEAADAPGASEASEVPAAN